MKKIFMLILPTLGLVYLPTLVSAQGSQQQNRVQDPKTNVSATVTPKSNQIQNENLIQVQNKGQETQLMVATQQVQQLMDVEGLTVEVGDKIRTLAKEQVGAQEQIKTQLDRLESKSNFMKKLFGPDFGAIKNLNQLMEQNRLRIQELQQLQNQVTNQAEKTQLQEAIQTLLNQNTDLREQVKAEEKVGSIFGWLIKLFNN
jgi:hypothetical protein